MTTLTVTNNSSSAIVVGSLLWTIDQAAAQPPPVTIRFADAVTQIDINGNVASLDGSNVITANNLIINGLLSDNVTRVRIRNVNSVPGCYALFSATGTAALTFTNIEMFRDPLAPPAVPCQFISTLDVALFQVSNSFFHDNVGGAMVGMVGHAGAITTRGTTAISNFTNSVFQRNASITMGGAVIIQTAGSFIDCQFFENSLVTGSPILGGGAVYAQRSAEQSLVDITYTRCTFNANVAGGSFGNGGAIFTRRTGAFINNSAFTNNTAVLSGGGIFSNPGTQTNQADLTVNFSIFSSNTASSGGAITALTSNTDMRGCSFANNTATGLNATASFGGGAIDLSNSRILLYDSLFNSNISQLEGGGAFSADNFVITALSLVINCTFTGNASNGIDGGAIRTTGAAGFCNFLNCTIANNASATNGGGISNVNPVLVRYGNNIIANNTSPVALTSDVFGVVTSLGTNLVGIGSGANGFGPTDIVGTVVTPVDPQLGPLANNGGVTQTMAIAPTSPAVDAANPAIYPGIDPILQFDQRAVAPFFRFNPTAADMDIGAYELQQIIICFRDNSKVLVKDIATNEIHTVNISAVTSDKHLVYDVKSDNFVPIIYNAVGAKITEFYRLEADLFEDNIPSEDLDVTGPHLILQGGQRRAASEIPGALKIETDPELVYSICTEGETTILVNNTEVIGWDSKKWDRYTQKRNISWINNKN